MPREFRSTGRGGRRGRSIHELTITGREKTHNRDCLFSDGGGRIRVLRDHGQTLWLISKPAKLAPFYIGANTVLLIGSEKRGCPGISLRLRTS